MSSLSIIDKIRNLHDLENIVKSFTSSDLKQHVGDVLSAAAVSPVSITKHDKPRFVLMSVEEYERRRTSPDPRKVFAVEETPDEVHDVLMEALDRQLEDLTRE